MKTKTELHVLDAAADAWLPESIEVRIEDDFAPEFAQVKGVIRKTPAAVVLERDRRLFANELPFWDDRPEGMSPEQFAGRKPAEGQYSI
jgi:hypothetical protein